MQINCFTGACSVVSRQSGLKGSSDEIEEFASQLAVSDHAFEDGFLGE